MANRSRSHSHIPGRRPLGESDVRFIGRSIGVALFSGEDQKG